MAAPSEIYAVDSTETYGTTDVNLTKDLLTLFPTVNGEIDNSISINRFENDIVKNIYAKSNSYNAIYDDSITYTAEPDAAGWVWKYYKRTAYPKDTVLINNAIVYGSTGDNRVYATGIKEDASSIYNYESAGNLKFIRDLDYNKILFECYATEYSNFTLLPKGTIQEGISDHPVPTMTDVELNQVDADKWYLGFNHRHAHIWNGSGWTNINAKPILICNGETVQSIQSAGKSFYSSINQYAASVHTGDNLSISVSSNNHLNYGYNYHNRMDRSAYTLGWNNSINTAPNWSDIPAQMIDTIRQWFIDNSIPTGSGNKHWFLISSEIKTVSDDMGMLVTVIGQFYLKNESTIHCSAFNEMFYPMVKGATILKMIAGFGCYYVADNTVDLTETTPDTLGDNSKIWLGAMSADGTTNGTWIKGNDINNYNGYNKDGDINNPDYDPSGGGGGSVDDEDNNDPVNTAGAPFAAGLCNYYAMTTGSVLLDHISEALGTWDIENTHKDLYKNLVSCKLIKPPAPIPTSGSAPFTIYGVKPQYEGADISLPVVSGNPDASFGPYQISRKFNDFRDYAPYTRVSIYLPYCGWCDLPSHVVGRSVSVHYYTDIIAATCKAVVFCSNNIIAEAAGVIGLDIPFVADNVGAKMQAVTAGMIAALGGGIQLGAGIGTMVSTKSGNGAKAALSGASQYLSGYSQMAMAFNENTTEISGKNGDGCCLSGATNIIIKIVRPKKGSYTTAPYTPPGYGHNVGFVSQKQVRVGNVSGLLIADNVDTSGIAGATEAERAEIKRVLETGLIVNSAPE